MSRVGNFACLGVAEQVGHITAEVTRARVWESKADAFHCQEAVARAIELVALFLSGNIPDGFRREMTTLKVVLQQYQEGAAECGASLMELEQYLLQLFMVSRV
ncbi:MAG: hypothetical protein HQL19_04785 [Candidatus Omnitrophica bacterium]|nr:hypothetical protein [Candidatus Omnitrophota bacterium]